MLQVDEIVNDTDRGKEIEQMEAVLGKYMNPQMFHGEQSVELTYDKNFSELCLWVELRTGVNPKEKTTLEFYQLLEIIKKNHGRKPDKI